LRLAAFAVAIFLGCGTAARPSPESKPVAARPASPPIDPLNLSFEQATDGWSSDPYGNGPLIVPSGYEVAVDPAIRHDGERSLRIAGEGGSAVVVRSIPLDAYRGRRIHLHGWMRTRDVVGSARFLVRVDGATGPLAFDNMADRVVTGDTEWTRYEIKLRVDREATAVVVGFVLAGRGQTWIDGLELASSESPTDTEVRGVVVDASGRGVSGAVVAANRYASSVPAHVTTTATDGSFAFKVTDHRWAFTATSDAGVAAYLPPQAIDGGKRIQLALGGDGITIEGRVVALDRMQADHVVASRRSTLAGGIFATRPDTTGRYRLRLPRASTGGYDISLVTQGLAEHPKSVDVVDQTLDFRIGVAAPPPADVVAWIKRAAQPLVTVEAGRGFADLARFGQMIGDARVVGLGEATHGGREFFQLKHRMIEYLVVEKGFRMIAFEENRAYARRVNDYVLHGKGNAAAAIKEVAWIWQTEEVLALLEWMRAYNQNPKHKTKVQFVGIDMQETTLATTNLLAYLDKVDAAYRRTLPASISTLATGDTYSAWPKRPEPERASLRAAAAAIVTQLDRERGPYVKRSSAAAWRLAREDAGQLAQALEFYDARQFRSTLVRDRAMAENIAWIVDEPRTKVVVWAHNRHLSKGLPLGMGAHLHRRFGAAYRAVNLAFSSGGTRASPATSGGSGDEIRAFELGPAPDSDATAMFTKAGLALAIVDLRAAPPGPIADWLLAPHPVRTFGYVFREGATERNEALAQDYDVLAFIATTTAARGLAPASPPKSD
jgi:erythromycin esterase